MKLAKYIDINNSTGRIREMDLYLKELWKSNTNIFVYESFLLHN